MALNAGTLGDAIEAAILANVPSANEGTDAIEQMADSIATAVVSHIVANAVVATSVPGTGLVAPSGGGPVTGAAAGTGTIS